MGGRGATGCWRGGGGKDGRAGIRRECEWASSRSLAEPRDDSGAVERRDDRGACDNAGCPYGEMWSLRLVCASARPFD